MISKLRRFARRVLLRLGVIDESFNRARPVDHALGNGLTSANRPGWMHLTSDLIESQNVNRHYANLLGTRSLVHAALRSGSLAMRDPLSYRLTGGRFDYSEMREIIRAYGSEGSRAGARLILDSLVFADLEYFQKVLAGKNGTTTDKDLAVFLLDYLAENPKVDTLVEAEQILFVSKLIAGGRLEAAQRIVADWTAPTVPQRQVRTDVISPFHGEPISNSEDLWLVAFNSVYSRYGLERVTLADTDASPYDRLRSVASSTVADGPLITVIMSCFKPGEEIWTGVESTLSQSWANLELIVIDDGSGPEYTALLDEIEASDPRVRVLRPTVNKGTYACRNEAIDAASGEYITMQDSDDWMHPRRLELHMRHLLANPEDIANVSSCFRVSEELFFSQEHGFKLKLCEPSLFFHKQRSLDLVGYFDPVRKAADGEYRRRLELATGRPVERLISLPALTLQRTLSTSLSTSDFGESWMHESRLAYRSAYTRWHGQAVKNKQSLRIERELVKRPFPAPSRISGAPIAEPVIDVLFLADAVVRTIGGTPDVAALVSRAKQLAAEGKVVGFTQVWTVRTEADPPFRIAPELQKLINAGTVAHVLFDEVRAVKKAVVLDAATLQFPPSMAVSLTVDAVEVSASSTAPYTKLAVETATQDLFGLAPIWN